MSTGFYKAWHAVLESDFPMPELEAAEAGPQAITFSVQACLDTAPPGTWLREVKFPSGDAWLAVGRVERGYLLRFPGLADFTVSADGRRVVCAPEEGAGAAMIRHLLLDQVLPLVFSLHGRTVLHASAVMTGAGAVVFAGRSGDGKSTLAASFGQAGAEVVCDDCLVVERNGRGFLGLPAYPGLRLWESGAVGVMGPSFAGSPVTAASSKYRVSRAAGLRFRREAARIACIYFLARGAAEITIERVAGSDCLARLYRASMLLDSSSPAMLKEHFERLTELSRLAPVFEVAYPREFARIAEVRTRIEEHAVEVARAG